MKSNLRNRFDYITQWLHKKRQEKLCVRDTIVLGMSTHTVKKEILKQQINSIFTRATTIQFQLEWQYTFLTTSWHFLFIIFWCRITWSGLESQWVSFMKRCFLLWQVLNKGINIYKRRTYYIMNRLKQCKFVIELLFSNLDAYRYYK